jgi:hypothetical protein
MLVKIHRNEDHRRFSIPHRNTRNWEQQYDESTSVESCNSRLKEHLTVNDVHESGMEKVKTHVYFNAIVLLASALAMAKMKRQEKAFYKSTYIKFWTYANITLIL